MRSMLLHLLPELGDVLASDRLRQYDRRLPGSVTVEREDGAHLLQHRLRCRMVHLVDRDHIRNLHDPRLERLHRVSRAWHEHEDDGIGNADHLDLALTRAHGLEKDKVLARSVENEQRLQGGLRETSEVAARAHRADEDAWIEEVVGKADAIAEQRAMGERARGID